MGMSVNASYIVVVQHPDQPNPTEHWINSPSPRVAVDCVVMSFFDTIKRSDVLSVRVCVDRSAWA